MTATLTARRPEPSTTSQRLRDLARQVERLAVGGRTDPETIVLGKLTIARDIRRIAREIER